MTSMGRKAVGQGLLVCEAAVDLFADIGGHFWCFVLLRPKNCATGRQGDRTKAR